MRITLDHATVSHARLSYDADGNMRNRPVDTHGFYFEIQSDGNYETITTSEIYESHDAAQHAIDLLAEAGLRFEFVDKTV